MVSIAGPGPKLSSGSPVSYHLDVNSRHGRPGIAKTRRMPLVGRRNSSMIRSTDYRWRQLFETADVLSEGAIRKEAEGAVYYGSTSVLLPDRSHGGNFDDAERDELLRLLQVDPHARLRAIRIACLEAELRARRTIGAVRAELVVREDARGVRIDVDVESQVFSDSLANGNSSRSTAARPRRRS